MNPAADAQPPSARNLLLIEDDLRLAALVRDYLEQEGFQVSVAHRGDTAVETFSPADTDLVILDLMLPGLSGLEVCSQLRRVYGGPILILTARNSDIDHVMGLELGADDFVSKPIEPPVLLARIRALLRRAQPSRQETREEELRFGRLRISLSAHQASLDGAPVELTTQEFELLRFLARNAGRVLSRDEIYNNIRGIEYDGLDRTVDVRISRLRRKLNDSGEHPQRIKTIWGRGYLFVAEAWD